MNKEKVSKSVICTIIIILAVFRAGFAQSEEETGQGLHKAEIGGYGEMVYYHPTAGVPESQKTGTLDFRRFVLETGYRFSDDISFHSELEVEHTRVEPGENSGEISVEEAYINFRLHPALNIRTGIMLVPVGLTNLENEPVDYPGVNRPPVERYIIPSTWREAGAGLFGELNEKISYQIAFMAGLDPSGLSGALGIREARQEGFKSSMQNISLAGRLDYHLTKNGLAGVSAFYSGLANKKTDGQALNGSALGLYEAHLQWKTDLFQLKGLAVYSHITQSDKINRYYGKQVGSEQYGLYALGAVNVLKWFAQKEKPEAELWVFGRISQLNTQAAATDFPVDKSNQLTELTLGLNYNPVEHVVIKADYEWMHRPLQNTIQQVNIGLGFDF